MESVEDLTPVHVMLDGKAMTATHASPCLAVCMEVAMVLHWLAHASIPLNGQEDFVIHLFVRAAPMVIALLLACANATLAGEVQIARNASH